MDLYREWKIEEWCEYLYNNIWVFIDWCKSIRVMPRDREEIQNEAILEAHTSILKSLDMSYSQIYNYVKIRVIWRIKNLYKRESEILNRFYNLDVDTMTECIDLELSTKASDKTILEFVIKWILTLSEKEKEVIYLRVFNYPHKTIKELSDITWICKQSLSSRYVTAIKKIKEYLQLNWINYESVF